MKRGDNPFNEESTSTPCVGICSTTYGDLVCRGCKRFSHEVVRWNTFEDDQKSIVWDRLLRLRRESINACVGLRDLIQLYIHSQPLMKVEEPTLEHRIYEVLLNLDLPLQELGIESVGGRPSENRIEILQRIEDEFYHRACAYYAHAFKRGFQ